MEIGIEGVSRKVKAGYVGVNGVARKFADSTEKISVTFSSTNQNFGGTAYTPDGTYPFALDSPVTCVVDLGQYLGVKTTRGENRNNTDGIEVVAMAGEYGSSGSYLFLLKPTRNGATFQLW